MEGVRRYVCEGIHLESGRAMSIVIRDDPDSAPKRLLSIVEHMPECSLAALVECLGASGPAYALAVGKIIGDAEFLKRHNIVPGTTTVLKFDHLLEQYPDESAPIEFMVMHKRELDKRLSKNDAVHFVAVDGAPYFIGDFNKAHPTGVLEPAATVKMRDIIWLDDENLMAGPEDFWHFQYLHEIRISDEARSKDRMTIRRILYDQHVKGVGNTLGDIVHYKSGGRFV